ncbi:hypothetical protein F5877DRAFT_86067 [Lentinula edodes]|nr:hypothetical protein F5877DRAFT_86067 [Lentinula edodes]
MHRSRHHHRQQTPLEETKTSFAIHTDTDGSNEEYMVYDHISKHDSDGDEEEGDDNDDNNDNIEDELEDCTPPPPPPKRRKKAAGRSDTSEQRMSTRVQTNGKPKEPNDAQLRREYEAMKKREAKLKKRVQAYEENVYADSNQDIESEDETQGNIIWGPAARPLETISTTNTVKKIAAKKWKTNRSATSTPHSAVLTSLATSASHSTATSQSTTPSHSTPTSAMAILSSTCLASPGMPQVNDALSTTVSCTAFTEEKLPLLNFHAHYTATGKPKAEDYNATGKAILLRACHDFKAKVIGLNFFPTPMTWAHWAEEAFLAACANANCAHSAAAFVVISSSGPVPRSKLCLASMLTVRPGSK